ncbi:putative phosphoenolpyruvate synthase isoform X1 [Diabrotica virgifera virgifera]|uniref:Uncharacterized protein LOC114335322 isoform X1 n=1 Tax=Diabrotica virgifera virgifera TaxID=50390 RepID=A0A6P7FXZ5_DIAVI|nr:putative phosphoenolpyruvate synthase isoform X1 [Diabrotica virgifera virgifera]
MDILYNFIYYLSLLSFPFMVYFLFVRKHKSSVYSGRDWFYLVKLIVAKKEVKKYQEKYRKRLEKIGNRIETEIFAPTAKWIDTQTFYGLDEKGNSLTFRLEIGIDKIAEASLHLRLQDGNIYVLPGEKGGIQTTISKYAWKIAGLNVEILEPLRKLRITFNGLLKNQSCTDFEKVEHIQFNFIYTAICSPHFFPQDIDTALFAKAVASDHWRDGSWRNNMIHQYGYEQLGTIKGFVKGDSYPVENILNLPGNRSRTKGISDRFLLKRALRLIVIDEYGSIFNIILKVLPEGNFQLNYGFALLSNERRYPITDIDLQMRHVGEHKTFPDCIKSRVKVNGKTYKIVVYLNKQKIIKSSSYTEYGYEYYTIPAKCHVDLYSGNALVEFWYANKGEEVFIPKPKLFKKLIDSIPEKLITAIKDEESQILELTGGKGSSLALLSSMQCSSFIIPDGFIITTKAFNVHMSNNIELSKSISVLNGICCGNIEGDLEEYCKKIEESFKTNSICPEVQNSIINQLKKYSHDSETLIWAVRSSAIGEDSDELSAAGQYETFLGCKNEEELFNNILACWASLYNYKSVQYRWQHGLPIITEMAVVVQKMIQATAAGVLFTCHPSTSNPSQMVITSNFGLGETVVSGESDPDNFILNRTWNEQIYVMDKSLGNKHKVLKMTNGSLEEIIDNQIYSEAWSISEKQAVDLGKIGILLEQAFGNPRDIEWAYSDEKIYILQSRPITTLNQWSDFELSHEMDTPVRTKNSYYTVANVREVIPKAVTVLTHSTSVKSTDWAIQKWAQQNFDRASRSGLITYQHNMMLDVITLIHRHIKSKVHVSGLVMDLAIFGHPVLDDKIHEVIKNRFGIASTLTLTKDITRIMSHAWVDNAGKAKILVNDLNLDVKDGDDVRTIFMKIDGSLDTMGEVSLCHVKTSSVSVFFQIIAMNIMLERNSELSTEHISDFAAILSSCKDVISAEVPIYLEDVAKILKENECAETFCNINPSEGVSFLKNECPKAYDVFCEFMDRHGHRCLYEFEMNEPSWRENPSLIISMIQANTKNLRTQNKESESIEDIVNNLKSITSNITRSVIKLIIKKIRIAVACREETKSEMIRGYDKIRQAYRHLGKRMVCEGLIPSKDLIYHLTHEEIGSLIRNRNPVLITKAVRRKKLYPRWVKLEFPEVMEGGPMIKKNNIDAPSDSLTEKFKGTPVYSGVVEARACVITSFEEIDQLKLGDILITYSTDIGWTPCFPMLSGIITELGGLISHGAVVAREYGLPCIVGVQNVTKNFKTGDIIQINGNTGELGKIN